MKKILILSLLSLSLLFGSNDTASSKDRDIQNNSVNDVEEVIYEHLKKNESGNLKITTVTKSETYYYQRPVEKDGNTNGSSSSDNNSSDNNTKSKTFFLQGYCFGSAKPLDISRLSSLTYLRCNFDEVDARLASLLVPDAFSKALIGKPLYVSTNNKRYTVLGGVIMTEDRTSINLAHIVNDRKLETFLTESAIKTADIATTEAQNYLDAVKAAKTSQEASYSNTDTSNQTIVVTNSAEPEMSDYLASAGVQFVSQLFKTGAELIREDLPYIFQTQANAVYYVDIMITNDNSQLPNMNIEGTSITRNPTLEQSKTQSNISLSNSKETSK